MSKGKVFIGQEDDARKILGEQDSNLKAIRGHFGVRTSYRNGYLHFVGDREDVDCAVEAVDRLRDEVGEHGGVPEARLYDILGTCKTPEEQAREEGQVVLRLPRGRRTATRTPGQARYVECILSNDIVFCIGPAGTGKTYLAVAAGLHMLREGQVSRLVLVRPAVEAGEKLGFLPGDYRQKVNPYLRPLYDALTDMLPVGELSRYVDQGVVEVAPLAYMRGRTLGHAFVILDEAQNTTDSQMMMFLTRLGVESHTVITGDITQVDLPEGSNSGLLDAMHILRNIEGIGQVELDEEDIVRHRLVRQIVAAYEGAQKMRRARSGGAHGKRPRKEE